MVASELDEKLLIETAQRDPRHFAELYRMHFDRVYAYVSRRVATRSDAQDLTAEVFQQALAKPRAVRVARRSVRRLALSHRGQCRHGPPSPHGAGPERAPEPGAGAGRGRARRAARVALSRGPRPARGPAEGHRDAVRPGQDHRRDRPGARAKRGSREAATVPRARKPAGATGSGRCLSAIPPSDSTSWWTGC